MQISHDVNPWNNPVSALKKIFESTDKVEHVEQEFKFKALIFVEHEEEDITLLVGMILAKKGKSVGQYVHY